MNLKRTVLTLLAAAAMAAAVAAAPSWESVDRIPASASVQSREAGGAGFTMVVAEGYVYLTVPAPTSVKIFTILGQLVAEHTLSAGTYRYRLGGRGVYLLKAGNTTRRITL